MLLGTIVHRQVLSEDLSRPREGVTVRDVSLTEMTTSNIIINIITATTIIIIVVVMSATTIATSANQSKYFNVLLHSK